MKKITRIEFILSFLMPLIGLSCIFFSEHLSVLLPYIMGAALIIVGGGRLIIGLLLMLRGYAGVVDVGSSIVILIVGIVAAIRGPNAVRMIGTVWGLIGIQESAQGIQSVISALHTRQRFAGTLAASIFRLVVALMLLFDPVANLAHHVIIMGVDILADTVKHPVHRLRAYFYARAEEKALEKKNASFTGCD